jgi:DNA-binding beta-propeller fold protein YncE
LTGAGKPVAIAVAHDGTVYVANQGTLGPPHGASILVYPKGHTMPSQRIPIAYDSFPFGLALDSSGNLFATVNHYVARSKTYQGAVYEFAAGSSKGKNLGLEGLANELTGMATDKSNNLLIVDDLKNAYYVLVFPPGKKSASQKIKISSGQAAVGVAINRENTEIWVTTGWSGEVDGISYPGGSLLDRVAHPRGWAFGVAVSPASN